MAARSQHGYGILRDVEEISEGRVVLPACTLYAAVVAVADLVARPVAGGRGRAAEPRRCSACPVLVSALMLMLPKDSHLSVVVAVCYGVPSVVLVRLGGLPRHVSGRRTGV